MEERNKFSGVLALQVLCNQTRRNKNKGSKEPMPGWVRFNLPTAKNYPALKGLCVWGLLKICLRLKPMPGGSDKVIRLKSNQGCV